MKKYIKIPFNRIDFNTLTRNQILYLLNLLKNENDEIEFKKIIYGTNRHNAKADKELIVSRYRDVINEIREMDDHQDVIDNYFKMKVSTYDIIIKEQPTQNELRIILWLLIKYRTTYRRTRQFDLNGVLKELFGPTSRNYKKLFLNTLDKLMQWKYPDDSLMIKKYELNKNILTLYLDERKRNIQTQTNRRSTKRTR